MPESLLPMSTSSESIKMSVFRNIIRRIIDNQIYLSHKLDRIFPNKYRVDGSRDFIDSFAPRYLRSNLRVVDVGGGKCPFIHPQTKADLNLFVVGLDIDRNELNAAPPDAYDDTVCTDITMHLGQADADLVICQAVLEHVQNTDQAFAAISSILAENGRALIFVPSRNAVFARLNLLLPQALKQKLLYAIFPQTIGHGFPAYYDKCTPNDFRKLAKRHGMVIEEERVYFESAYFTVLAPVHLAWRLWLLLFHMMAGNQAAETFSVALKKRAA